MKGIAHALADTFVSRNNDVFGYWALGVLYREALARSESTLQLDLLGEVPADQESGASVVESRHRQLLRRWAEARQVSLARASIAVSFGLPENPKRRSGHEFGDPFEVSIRLDDSSGREVVVHRSGSCRPHDPDRETRSSRWQGV